MQAAGCIRVETRVDASRHARHLCRTRQVLRGCSFLVGLLWLGGLPAAASPLTVELLLKDGWEIVGYAGTLDVRATLILFRRKDTAHLVQCSILYDVTRNPRVITNCYELH